MSLYMRPDLKFQTGLSFASVYIKKSYRDGHKITVCNSLNKYGRDKKHGKTIIIDRHIKYIATCRFLHNQYYLQIGYEERRK